MDSSKLESSTCPSSRVAKSGIEAKFGQSSITNLEKQGNEGNSRLSTELVLHQPCSLGSFVSQSSCKPGKNVVDDETSWSSELFEIYSRSVISSNTNTLIGKNWSNGGKIWHSKHLLKESLTRLPRMLGLNNSTPLKPSNTNSSRYEIMSMLSAVSLLLFSSAVLSHSNDKERTISVDFNHVSIWSPI